MTERCHSGTRGRLRWNGFGECYDGLERPRCVNGRALVEKRHHRDASRARVLGRMCRPVSSILMSRPSCSQLLWTSRSELLCPIPPLDYLRPIPGRIPSSFCLNQPHLVATFNDQNRTWTEVWTKLECYVAATPPSYLAVARFTGSLRTYKFFPAPIQIPGAEVRNRLSVAVGEQPARSG